jgi:hypothetical protein
MLADRAACEAAGRAAESAASAWQDLPRQTAMNLLSLLAA